MATLLLPLPYAASVWMYAIEVEAAVVRGGGSADLTLVWVNSLQGTTGPRTHESSEDVCKLERFAPIQAAEAAHSCNKTARACLIV